MDIQPFKFSIDKSNKMLLNKPGDFEDQFVVGL